MDIKKTLLLLNQEGQMRHLMSINVFSASLQSYKEHISFLFTELVSYNACTPGCILEGFASIHNNVLGRTHSGKVLVVGPMCSEKADTMGEPGEGMISGCQDLSLKFFYPTLLTWRYEVRMIKYGYGHRRGKIRIIF